jgi:chemotaxis protein methyltransferase CheR
MKIDQRPGVSVLAQRAPVVESHARSDHLSLMRLAALVTRELGIRMPAVKLPMLQSRLLRRMRALSITSIALYEQYLSGAAKQSELRHFVDVVTTHKTDFFREPVHFDYLTQHALPSLLEQLAVRGEWHCRVWSAGCSTGQEAYTLAMVLDDFARRRPAFSFSLVATDVSLPALQQAAAGIYGEELVAPVPMPMRKAYLLRSIDRRRALVRIVPALRRQIAFSQLNFMDERYPVRGPFDVVFFRNVMIYFDRPTQQQVIRRQCGLMRQGGYLFTSQTESLFELDVPLEGVANAVYRHVR